MDHKSGLITVLCVCAYFVYRWFTKTAEWFL